MNLGRGTFFGPLCIAGVYAPDKRILQELYKTKIQDSKTLRDTTILSLAKTIRSLCTYDVMTLYPEKYNELYGKFRNLNALLAWGHATVIDNLAPCPAQEVFAISDQFASSEQLLLEALKKEKLRDSTYTKDQGRSRYCCCCCFNTCSRSFYYLNEKTRSSI